MENSKDLLTSARARYTQRQLADQLNVTQRTVARWESGETPCPTMLAPALRELLGMPARNVGHDFTFIDLFAGIGGIRQGFEKNGGRCVFTSEWNDWAKKTYLANFPDEQDPDHHFVGDIQVHPAKEVPDHDVLLGGFPCQPFSIAGVSKKNALGRAHGFEDATQGTLFFDVARDPNPHQGFGGGGPHFCMGNMLARTQLREIWRRLLTVAPGTPASGASSRPRSLAGPMY